MKQLTLITFLFFSFFEGYCQVTNFSLQPNYVAVRTPARTANQYYEFWDSNIGWAGIACGYVNSNGNLTSNSSLRPIILQNHGTNGIFGSSIGFNSIINTNELPNKFIKLSGTGQNGGASIIADYSGNMFFQMYNAGSESESIINYTPQITFQNNGQVGIGTVNPAYKLDVIGTIRAREIKVDLNGADFVFEKNYKLMPLNELEKFIKEQKHLPEVAPAKEMEENGTDLGNLNSKLLQKMEEMTLYIIEQNKKIQALEEKIQKMESASK